jgi:hypothetical protein
MTSHGMILGEKKKKRKKKEEKEKVHYNEAGCHQYNHIQTN